jgi:D-psicose/D-tagatose/L-ribulose 3-epimerase
MIKYGAHCYIFTDHWTDDCLAWLDRARAWGLSCVEIAIGDDADFSPKQTREHAAALGLELIVSPGGVWPQHLDLSAEDPNDRAAGLAWHKRQVDLGAELAAIAYTGALYGHPGTVLRRIAPPDEYARAAEGLHALAEYAAQYHMPVVLEPMSHFRTHMVNTPEQAMRLIETAAHPNLGVLLDTYHMATEVRDYARAVETVRGRLWGVHACENDRGVPGGGLVPWEAFLGALKAAAFDGYLILEAYNSSLGDFAERRGMFHNVCPNGEAFVKTGVAFLKQGLAA